MRAFPILAGGVLALTFTASTARASTIWGEGGDAGHLLGTAQILTGTGTLDEIQGLISPNADVDLYAIFISDPLGFSATTVGGAFFDTQLFLFDSSGAGISFNDDDPSSGPFVLQSSLSSTFVLSSGLYYLGISLYDNDPLNAASEEIWADLPAKTERSPDGPGATGPLWNWDFGGGAGTINPGYSIYLTGVELVPPTSVVPEPATLLLLGTGLGAVAARRGLKKRA